ncbi:MAG: CRISPR-associated endonuclease Cas3'' [Panacagrimonas sp.]
MTENDLQAEPVAHVRQFALGGWDLPHLLADHLCAVSAGAANNAQSWGGSDWAALAGLWHDLGKYAADFQHYIRAASGFERENAHVEGIGVRVDHSSAGGVHAIRKLGKPGIVLANLILAHHAGLYDASDIERRLQGEKENAEGRYQAALVAAIPQDILHTDLKPAMSVPGGYVTQGAYALWLRMLFSCLVDEDFLDTENYMNGGRVPYRSSIPSLADLKPRFDAHMARFDADTEVKAVRMRVLHECRSAAAQAPGLFTLTVPTGGGKTLSSMAFALEHALLYGQRRIIYAIPYTSIIEQTADVFRGIFGDTVIEHHSNAESDKENARSRLACENWDAPIIVTTNVQFFESLFAARTSRCRKLHNIADSVVILDEAQLLPPGFLQPILDVLNLLTRHYGVTVVLSTATQPALTSRAWSGGNLRGLENVREIVTDPDGLYRMLKRVDVQMPESLEAPTSWPDIADRLCREDNVLAIVSRRADARELFRLMPQGTIHLSALMCGAHRSDVIKRIKSRLAERRENPDAEPVRVVSTQLVEAGVDLDFPVVYRALAGLDSIAQAAGRCNREGRLSSGTVHVFVPPKGAPPGLLKLGEQATRSLMSGHRGDPLDRALFTRYFEQLYRGCDLDEKQVCAELDTSRFNRGSLNLRTAAEKFKLIDNEESGYRSVFVPYRRDASDDQYAILLASLRKDGPQRWLLRKLQRYSVSLPGHEFDKLLKHRDAEEVFPGLFALKSEAQYNPSLGLCVDEPLSPEALVI